MSAPPRPIQYLYAALLRLLPVEVRRTYGNDMSATFAELYAVAAAQGRLATARLLIREAAQMWAVRQRSGPIRQWFPQDLDALARDLRHGVRALRRDAAVSAFAIAIVGLGIGASSTVFTVFHALLLRPLPFERPEELVWIANGRSDNLSAQTAQVANLAELRAGSPALADIAGFSPFYGAGDIRLESGGAEPERVTGVPVTENFFSLLGIQPRLGRFFSPEECRWNASKVVILSDAFWRRRFAADPSVIGRGIRIDGQLATVVGVMSNSFDFAGTFTPGGRADLFVPFPLSAETNKRGNTLALVGRLNPGADLPSARAQATVVGERIKSGRIDNYWRNDFNPRLSPLRDRVTGRVASAVAVLVGAVGFLMLVVCANLSSLLLARVSVRQRDIAVHAALGAERPQLIRQMLVESLLLSSAGAVLGFALAVIGTQAISRLDSAVPMLYTVRIDAAALGFIALVTVLAGVGFGTLPAIRATSGTPQIVLGRRSRGEIGGRTRPQHAIVIAEIAVVCVLLTGAGLLAHSLIRVLDVNLGFDSTNLIAVRVDPHRTGTTRATRNAYFDRILGAARSVPGIETLGLTDALPLGDNFGWRRWDARRPGQPEGEQHGPLVRMIDEGYLSAMKVPILAGRGFTAADTDGSEPVAIVNDALTAAFWPGRDAIGQTLIISRVNFRVIGVVPSVKYFALERDSGPEMYLPLRQIGDYQVVDLVVRGAAAPAVIAGHLREALRRADPAMPVSEFRTMEQLIDRSLFTRRAIVWLVSAFAAFALILASLGIYAVMSYSVGQRQQEIGLRMALGASPRELQRGVLMQAGRLALVGLGLGVPAAWMVARAMQGMLFEVAATDRLSFAIVVAVLAGVTLLAGYLPARRASRVDPSLALRA